MTEVRKNQDGAHVVLCQGRQGGIDNYVLLPVEDLGFVAIKQSIIIKKPV